MLRVLIFGSHFKSSACFCFVNTKFFVSFQKSKFLMPYQCFFLSRKRSHKSSIYPGVVGSANVLHFPRNLNIAVGETAKAWEIISFSWSTSNTIITLVIEFTFVTNLEWQKFVNQCRNFRFRGRRDFPKNLTLSEKDFHIFSCFCYDRGKLIFLKE